MKKNPKRYCVLKNGCCVNSYEYLHDAKRCIQRLYNSGRVLPYDNITLYDREMLIKINY